jgi:hypothetical protein
LVGTEVEVSLVPLAAWPPTGWGFIRDLICAAMVMNAFSTLLALLAEVSRNSMPRVSANS